MIGISVVSLLSQGNKSIDSDKVSNVVVPNSPVFFQDDFTDLRESFKRFVRLKESDVVKTEKSAEELAAELAALEKRVDRKLKPNFKELDDEHQIGLVGIFKQNTTFAVLQVVNYQTRNTEYKKLQENDVLNGYKLVSVDENSIKLNNGARELSLALFKRLNG